ncbi:MAG: flagellar FliJ family protein [Rhodospirillaceae bacterium]
MSDLRPVIRLYRWRLDEKQRALAELHNREDQLVAEAQSLEEKIKAEQLAARAAYEVSFSYANFAKVAINRRHGLAQAIADIHEQITTASDDLAEAFQEMKRFELAWEARVKLENEQLRRKENEMIDETAAVGFSRRRNQENEQDYARDVDASRS